MLRASEKFITRITGSKGGNMNYQIQGPSIHPEQHGTGEPATFAQQSLRAAINERQGSKEISW
jgi:hypothetical protein